MLALLEVKDLHVEIDGKAILKGLNLTIKKGEVHAIMGPNGSGKSTLSNVLMGHPSYTITQGTILFEGEDITTLAVNERAKKGMFLAFQYPTAIPGVTVANFVRTALKAILGDEKQAVKTFRKLLKEKMALLKMDIKFATRYVNDGFSGGEKKRLEILQMAVLNPKLSILDETDSGLDIDALRIVSEGINTIAANSDEKGVLLITHYQRMLDYVKPNFIHVLQDGVITKSGGPELALELEQTGYLAAETATA
ncbi:MAG: Fe-S cluster assembly ATPase SufC [Elusimicrobia bacterium]|nr:MAG: Fe-S cluster assembly ATPase SufC [Elusimicrobiota bacterium]